MHERDELKHFGVKGMKWGVWNEETKARRSGSKIGRYKRGKAFNKERIEYRKKEEEKLKKKYQDQRSKLISEAMDIAKKYDLDFDDGGGGDTSKFSEKELKKAGKQYLDKWDEVENLDQRIKKEAIRNSKNFIAKKYGDMAIKDIEHYSSVKNGLIFVTAESALLAVPLYFLYSVYK